MSWLTGEERGSALHKPLFESVGLVSTNTHHTSQNLASRRGKKCITAFKRILKLYYLYKVCLYWWPEYLQGTDSQHLFTTSRIKITYLNLNLVLKTKKEQRDKTASHMTELNVEHQSPKQPILC